MFCIQWHNKLRERFDWYHRWHNFNYVNQIHFLIFIVFIGLLGYIFLNQFYFIDFFTKKPSLSTYAKSSFKLLNTQADWEKGIYNINELNITNSEINIIAEQEISLSDKVITANPDTDKDKVVDKNINTGWIITTYLDVWRVDLGEVMDISKMRWFFNSISAPVVTYSSLDNLTYVERASVTQNNIWYAKNFSLPIQARYLKLAQNCGEPAPCGGEIDEFEIYYTPLQATHTSAFAQIGDTSSDPGRYVSQYQTFTPTETQPANSTITYRFRRTNQDGSWTGDWTSYVDYTGSPIDLTQFSELNITQADIDNHRTYLQVETKFERTDTTANPVVSDYTVQYHTNKPPNKPVAE